MKSFRSKNQLARRLILTVLVFMEAIWVSSAFSMDDYHLGVFAYRPKEVLIERFQPLSQYLSHELSAKVHLHVLNQKEIEQALAEDRLDFLLTNPSHYLWVKKHHAMSGAVATLVRVEQGKEFNTLGGVIITHPDFEDIYGTLANLSGKNIAIAGSKYLGGFQVQAYEFLQAGIDFESELNFIEVGSHDAVVEHVLTKKVDAGFIRTGVIEQLNAEGRLKQDQLAVINRQDHTGFPFVSSTRLYPEWPFVIISQNSHEFTSRLSIALMKLSTNDNIVGQIKFSAPLDYHSVENLGRALGIEPFDIASVGILNLFNRYYGYFLVLIVSILLLSALLLWYFRSTQVLNEQSKRLNFDLELNQILLDLPGLSEKKAESDFLQYCLELVENLTASRVSFAHFVNDDKETLRLITWSKRTLEHYCQAHYDEHYPISKAGIWAESFRTQAPVIVNDYSAYKDKKGLPEGHAHLGRFISIPVLEESRVHMLLGVGNKKTPYTQAEVRAVQLVANEMWRLVQMKRDQVALKIRHEQYTRLVKDIGNNFALYSLDSSGKVSFISESASNIFEKETSQILGASFKELVDWNPAELLPVEKMMSSNDRNRNYIEAVVRFCPPNSLKEKTLRLIQHKIFDEVNGELVAIDGLLEDITELEKTRIAEKRAASVFKHASEGIVIADAQTRILDVNDAFTNITGYTKTEVLGQKLSILKSGRHDKNFYTKMWLDLSSKGEWSGEIWNKRKDGSIYPEKLAISAVYDSRRMVSEYIGLFSDITQIKDREHELEKIAHYDSLTGLPNRAFLNFKLEASMLEAKETDFSFAVAFLDLDGFKKINDQYGHEAGDYVLIELASEMMKALREDDVLSRLGGDEFIVLLKGVNNELDIECVMEKLLAVCSSTVFYKKHALNVSASIGVCFYDGCSTLEANELLKCADQSMYQAKQKGKNQYSVYKAQISKKIGGLNING